MKKEIRDNQAIYENPLNFEQVYRRLVPTSPERHFLDPAYGSNVVLPTAGPGRGTYEAIHAARTLEDGTVVITFYAPDAKRVEVAGIGGSMQGRYDLEKWEDGYWKAEIKDIRSGFHYCVFIVDGVLTYNPTMPFGFGNSYVMNYFEVPEEDDFFLLKDVPHGCVRMEVMKSEMCGRWRNLYVYTPKDYDKTDKRYPVLYILHGGGENEIGWFWEGKLNYIADNLLAAGEMEEMLIVAASFTAPKEVGDNLFENVSFPEVISREIVPFIDENYRTIADRRSRCIAGLSAGGGTSRQIISLHPEVFANLGQFSSGGGFAVEGITTAKAPEGFGPPGATPMDKVYAALFTSPEEYNERFDLTFITCGTDDGRHAFTSAQVAELREKGYNVEYCSYPGYHEWDVWRYSARDLMKRLFKK
ncbi:MAG: hypothetical protein IIZ17_08115 [Eubacteriaceae bacterium]|nr:hypothetical protein [Eubacteriaceae bacterium]